MILILAVALPAEFLAVAVNVNSPVSASAPVMMPDRESSASPAGSFLAENSSGRAPVTASEKINGVWG